jgi:hypothetical protein
MGRRGQDRKPHLSADTESFSFLVVEIGRCGKNKTRHYRKNYSRSSNTNDDGTIFVMELVKYGDCVRSSWRKRERVKGEGLLTLLRAE